MVGTRIQRWCAKVRLPSESDACWEWIGAGARVGLGYGVFWDGEQRVMKMAYRYGYERFIGPIPEGMHMDHLCRNPRCVNPMHVEAVTPKLNVLRGLSPMANHARKTHCPQGHPLTLQRTDRNGSGRRCRPCEREREKRRPPRRKT